MKATHYKLLPAIGLLIVTVCLAQIPQEDVSPPFEIIPTANPQRATIYLPDLNSGEPIAYEAILRDEFAVIEGDIVFGRPQELTQGSTKSLHYKAAPLWSLGIVPYIISDEFSAKDRGRIEKAIAGFADTKILFRAKAEDDKNWLKFVTTDDPNVGGQSYYGQQGGEQKLWLNKDSSKWGVGTAIHEMCHALTIAHEQCRKDAVPKYIMINKENIMKGYEDQFAQLGSRGGDIGDFDFKSLMIYPPKAFSKNGKDTIVAVNGESFGQRENLSKRDIAGLDTIYQAEIAKR
jgi:hypothetical protein